MIVDAPIQWHNISEIPEDRKDGRDVLLWQIAGFPSIVTWCDGWFDAVGRPVVGLLWADLNAPEMAA